MHELLSKAKWHEEFEKLGGARIGFEAVDDWKYDDDGNFTEEYKTYLEESGGSRETLA
ncbi:MAG: hypothetical protein HQK52_19650 [Oligoflexia bacterium]|nr:hypothetical protein [Oligoflexia bacterium]